jgi:class 3 adenylate cyclase
MKDDSGDTVHTEQRRLAAIMFADMVGFSRQMGADEARMLRLLDTHNQVIRQAVVEHHGTVIKTVGDAFLRVNENDALVLSSIVYRLAARCLGPVSRDLRVS